MQPARKGAGADQVLGARGTASEPNWLEPDAGTSPALRVLRVQQLRVRDEAVGPENLLGLDPEGKMRPPPELAEAVDMIVVCRGREDQLTVRVDPARDAQRPGRILRADGPERRVGEDDPEQRVVDANLP